MNIKELTSKLNEMKILSGEYSLDGHLLADRIVLYHNYYKWEVFYLDERGVRHNQKEFSSEREACLYIYDLFKRRVNIW